MYCKNCGSQIGNEAKFCPDCGSQIPETITQDPENVQAPQNEQAAQYEQAPQYEQPQYEQPPQYEQQPQYAQAPQYEQAQYAQGYTPNGAPKKSKKTLFIILGIVLLLIIIGVTVLVINIADSVRKFDNNRGIISTEIDDLDDLDDIDDLFDSSTPSDIVANTSWISSDSSYMVFNKDDTFYWYQSKDNLSDNYYFGKYEFYTGEDALIYLSINLEKYGVTTDEMLGVIERSDIYDMDNLVCFVLNNESCIVDGAETFTETIITPYYGFLLKDGTYLDVANMNTANYLSFEKE